MANRSITVTLRANVSDFKNQFDAATKAAERTSKATEESAKRADTAMGQMVQSAQDNRAAWDSTGASLTAFGAATLGGLGLATKAAMDWESAWAGVQKTVDGTAPQMAALEDGLRGMARELPASHAEIAAVAEAAGQLGIETPNILGFTRTMIDMGEATNLSADEAATSLARFMNVMGTSQTDVGRLGASVVGLGNNFATTESEIVQMSQRLSGAGAQAGLTEGDVLGMAAAMSSVGIEAEAGGSAMSQTMKRIGAAVDEGGSSLELFAQVSGMTAEQFASAWNENPAMALDSFINGLSGVEEQGMTTNGVLGELGITGIRESDSLLRLSAASEQGADGMSLLAEAVQMGNDEFSKGSALIEEAAQRYETAESKIAMAGNALVDSGISIGAVVLPAVADLADRIGGLAGGFADLPGPVHGAIGALSGIAGAGALAAGSFLLIFPRVMDSVQAFKTLKSDMPGLASGLGKVGKAAGVAAGAIAVLNVAGSVGESFRDGAEHAELLSAQLLNISNSSDVTAESINGLVSSTVPFGVSVHGVGDALNMIDTDPVSAGIEGLTKTLLGVPTTTDVAAESLGSLDGALSQLVSGGYLAEFSSSFAAAVEDAEAYGHSAEDLIENLPGLKEALTPIATEMGLQADNATLAKIAMEGLDPAVVAATSGMEDGAGAAEGLSEELSGVEQAALDAASAIEEHVSALSEQGDAFLGARGAARDYADALKDAQELAGSGVWGSGTEEAREMEEALDGVASAYLTSVDAALQNGDSVSEVMSTAYDDIVALGEAYDIPQEELAAYLEAIGLTPETIEQTVVLETEEARAKWAALWDEVGYHPPLVIDPTVDPEGKVPEFTGLVGDIPLETDTTIGAETDGAIEEMYGFGSVVENETQDRTVGVDANIEPAVWEVNALEEAVNEAGGTVTINGDTVPGDQALDILMGIINSSDGMVTINGMPVPAEQALAQAVGLINASGGTVDIDGDPSGANSATDGAKSHADGTTGTIDVEADTGGAESATNHTARNRSSNVNQTASTGAAESALNRAARNRTSTITVFRSIRTTGRAMSARAGGGPVFGDGTETSDSIHAKLSHNEHVWAAREVRAAGGHDALANMRAQILAGAKTIRLASGGAADGSVRAVQYTPMYQSMDSQSVPATVDSGAIASAVAGAIASHRPMVQIGDRVLYGEMVRADRKYGKG